MSTQARLRFAPHLSLTSPDDGLFRHLAGNNPVDQIHFIADQGFTAVEDNFLSLRPEAEQAAMGRALAQRGLDMGVIVNTMVYSRPSFVLPDEAERRRLVSEVHTTARAARRVGATHVTTLSGTAHPHLPRDYQTANMIENLKWAGEAASKEGLVLALEPINHKGWPGTFMTELGHAYLISKAVDMPSVKVLYDLWHQQIHGGDLLANLELAWDEIAYIQVADNPGRVEPGAGEINFPVVFQRLAEKGFTGIVGLEFGPSQPGQAGESAVLEALRPLNRRFGARLREPTRAPVSTSSIIAA